MVAVEIPDKLKNFPWKLYEGNTDPGEHLTTFNLKMVNCEASDALRCRLFPETFARRANEWFSSLAPESVHDFTDLSARFLAQFSTSREEKANTQILLAMMQEGPDESLKSYLKRFTNHNTPLKKEHMSLCTAAFKHGLSAGPFKNSLTRRPAKTMEEICHRASGFIKEVTDDGRKKKRQE